ncbi:GIP, partial [Symbiodinium sp. KB8]
RLVEEIAALLVKDPVHKVRRPQLKNEGEVGTNASYSTAGAYNFGGVYGVTKYTREAPELTKKVTQLLRHDFPDEVFTSATIVKNASLPTHRDVYNERRSRNLISPIQVPRGAGVWEELRSGDVYKGKFHVMDVKGEQIPGQVHELSKPITIDPRRWHCAIQGDEGTRVVVAGHTIGSWRKLNDDMRMELVENGFVLPEEEEERVQEKKAWIPSMAKEMRTLEEIGAVKRLKGKEARDYLKQTGAVVVPGKAVYTVKPPSEEGQVCRRKTRIVSCGNFQPKNDAESNYSGGAVAEAVRLGIAEAARHRWCTCTGDVVSAFLRAPVPKGTCLALRPPMALIKAGLADREEVW